MRKSPDFQQMLRLLRREKTDGPVLFELFMNMPLYMEVNGDAPEGEDIISQERFKIRAWDKLGYDYATVHGSDFHFPTGSRHGAASISLNEGALIVDEASFDAYAWPDPAQADYSRLNTLEQYLPEGMMLNVMGPGGVLENVIALTGYDNLCIMLYEEPELMQRIFDEVGRRLLKYYEICTAYPAVGMLTSNDDWGFNTQTFLSPVHMRQYVHPWHKKIVEVIHRAGKPVILHSCGYMKDMMGDIIAMGYDAKHSFEDNIMPVEAAWDTWHDQIVLLGGIDMNFLCTQPAEAVKARVTAMLKRTEAAGCWAVGSGNSIPTYVPVSQYMGMLEAAFEYASRSAEKRR